MATVRKVESMHAINKCAVAAVSRRSAQLAEISRRSCRTVMTGEAKSSKSANKLTPSERNWRRAVPTNTVARWRKLHEPQFGSRSSAVQFTAAGSTMSRQPQFGSAGGQANSAGAQANIFAVGTH